MGYIGSYSLSAYYRVTSLILQALPNQSGFAGKVGLFRTYRCLQPGPVNIFTLKFG
jgi:hypothetical protein